MSEILRPYASAQYANGRRRFEIRNGDGGWFHYYDIADMMGAGSAKSSTVKCDVDGSKRHVPLVKEIRRRDIKGAILMPWITPLQAEDVEEHIQRNVYCWVPDRFYGKQLDTYGWHRLDVEMVLRGDADSLEDAQERIWEWNTSKDQKFTEMVQKVESYAGFPVVTHTQLKHTYGMCANGWWAFGIRRQAPPEDLYKAAQADEDLLKDLSSQWSTIFFFGITNGVPESTITTRNGRLYFGDPAWGLVIPLSGRPYLIKCRPSTPEELVWYDTRVISERVDFTEGEVESAKPESMAQSGMTYIVGVIDDCIVVGDVSFENFAYYKVEDAAQPIVPSGQVAVLNSFGQCSIQMAPVQFYPPSAAPGVSATVYSTYYTVPTNKVRSASAVNSYVYGSTISEYKVQGAFHYYWSTEMPLWWPKSVAWPPPWRPNEWPNEPPVGWPEALPWPAENFLSPENFRFTVDENSWTFEQSESQPFAFEVNKPVSERGEWVVPPAVSGGGIDVDVLGDGPVGGPYSRFRWRVTLEPTRHYHAFDAPLPTYATPFVTGLSIWQLPIVTDNGDPTFTDFPPLRSLHAQSGIGQEQDTMLEITVSNEVIPGPGAPSQSPFMEVREGAAVRAQVGVRLDDGSIISHDLGEYVVIEKNATVREAGFTLATWLQMLALDKWIDGTLNLRDFGAADAMMLVLKMAGLVGEVSKDEETGAVISEWCAIEDVGTTLIELRPDNRSWVFERGTPYIDILQRIAYDGARRSFIYCGFGNEKPTPLWKIRTGCRYCLAPRTEDNWAEHENNGWNSTGCVAGDIARTGNAAGVDFVVVCNPAYSSDTLIIGQEVEVESTALRSGEFATRVAVTAQTRFGTSMAWEISYTAEAPDEDPGPYYVGWRIAHVQGENDGTEYGTVKERMRALRQQIMRIPHNCRRIVLPLAATQDKIINSPALLMRPGHVVLIAGGRGLDTHLHKYRVVNVQHNVESLETVIFARRMVGRYG